MSALTRTSVPEAETAQAPGPDGTTTRGSRRRGGKERPAFVPGLPAVNLLSPWAFERIAVRRLRRRFLAAGAVLLVAAGAGWGVQTIRVADAEDLLSVEQAETGRLTERANALQPVKTFVAGVQQQGLLVTETMATEIYFSEVLESMQDAAPAGVVLDSIQVTLAPPVQAPAPAPAAGAEGEAAGGASTDGAAPPAAPAVASPCPGPDPFQTRVVVGCITLSGTAGSRAEVGQLVVALGGDARFVEPFISTTTTADAAEVTFSGSVGLSEKTFSRRYADFDQLLAGGR